MYIMSFGVIIGGIDRIFGNKRGYGKKLEEGFLFLGPTALSMVGIICLTPIISSTLGKVIVPLYELMGVDPAMFGGILAIDMGGYQLAMELAQNSQIGQYAGTVVAAIFGCTLVFTIPFGMGVIEKKDHPYFAKGIMVGFVTMPVGLVVGGIVSGLSLRTVIHQNIPVFILAVFLLFGLWRIPAIMVKGFIIFAGGIQVIITIGLVLGGVSYMTGRTILPGLVPIEDALAIVSSIGIVMLGSLPTTELLERIMKKPFTYIGNKCRINDVSIAGLLVSLVTIIPVLSMLKNMDNRGKVINVAYMVSACSMLAAHLGFTISTEPQLLSAVFVSKLCGAVVAVLTALFVTRSDRAEKERRII